MDTHDSHEPLSLVKKSHPHLESVQELGQSNAVPVLRALNPSIKAHHTVSDGADKKTLNGNAQFLLRAQR